jgi:hypothetical protein
MSGQFTDVFEHSFQMEEAAAETALLHPIPESLAYLDTLATRYYRPGWTARSLRGRLAVLSRRARDEISQTRLWIAHRNQESELSQWLCKRLVEESLGDRVVDPVGSRVYALVTVFMLLGDKGLEPFASRAIEPFRLSCRSEYRGLPAICEATRHEPAECTLASGDSNHPFRLSHPAADRLEHHALPPLEWRRLVAIHGRSHPFLGPELYDDSGRAYKPMLPVADKSLRTRPSANEPLIDPEDLIDQAFVQFQLETPTRDLFDIVEALKSLDTTDLAAALDRRVGEPPNTVAEGLGVRLGLELGQFTANAIRGRWALAHLDNLDGIYAIAQLARESVPHVGSAGTIDLTIETLQRLDWPAAQPDGPPLYFGLPGLFKTVLMESMCADMLLELVVEMMKRLPPEQAGKQIASAFDGFRNERILDWIEVNVAQPITGDWGKVAAANGMCWARVSRWLDAGPPRSHVALHAMMHCLQTASARAAESCDAFPQAKIRSPLGIQHMSAALETYAQQDPVPWVRELIAMLVPALPRIIEF